MVGLQSYKPHTQQSGPWPLDTVHVTTLSFFPDRPQMCILAGCDFLPNVAGVGIKKAHAMMRRHRDFVKVSGAW